MKLSSLALLLEPELLSSPPQALSAAATLTTMSGTSLVVVFMVASSGVSGRARRWRRRGDWCGAAATAFSRGPSEQMGERALAGAGGPGSGGSAALVDVDRDHEDGTDGDLLPEGLHAG